MWKKGRVCFRYTAHVSLTGWVILVMRKLEFSEVLTYINTSNRTFFINHFSGGLTSFWVFWYENREKNVWKQSFLYEEAQKKTFLAIVAYFICHVKCRQFVANQLSAWKLTAENELSLVIISSSQFDRLSLTFWLAR